MQITEETCFLRQPLEVMGMSVLINLAYVEKWQFSRGPNPRHQEVFGHWNDSKCNFQRRYAD